MSVKLIAVDMDDTLVDDSGLPGDEATKAIGQARARGIRVTLATGRMFCSAEPCAAALGLDLPLITYNGALIRSTISGEVLAHTPVPLDVCLDVAEYCKERALTLNVYVDDGLRVSEMNDEVRYYEELGGVRAEIVGDLPEYLQALRAQGGLGSTKLLIVTDPVRATLCMDELSGRFAGRLAVTKSKSKFVEMMRPEVSKARALSFLADSWGIKPSEVMAIGDSLNDLEMIAYAGIGVAVANASGVVRQAADVVTTRPGGLGVAEAISSVLGERGQDDEKR